MYGWHALRDSLEADAVHAGKLGAVPNHMHGLERRRVLFPTQG